jgi:hypothetical protein
MAEQQMGELTQNLYRWAIVQMLATEKFDTILQPLIKYHEQGIVAEFTAKKVLINPKDKKALSRNDREYKTELQRLRKDFSNYSELNKRMVKRFATIDDNTLLKLASSKLEQFLVDNIQITRNEPQEA